MSNKSRKKKGRNVDFFISLAGSAEREVLLDVPKDLVVQTEMGSSL